MAKKTIKLKNNSNINNEYTPASTVTPGELVELASATTIQAHSSAAGNVIPPMFVCENELEGENIDTDLTTADKAIVWIPGRGDEVYAFLADGQNVAVNDALESDGAGALNKHVADTADSDDSITVIPNAIVGVALEAVDLSASANTTRARIKIRIV